MEIKQIRKKSYIGITYVFYKENVNKVIEGILKSLIISTSVKEFERIANSKAKQLAKFYNLYYLGINDIFVVSDEFKENTILGRLTDYDNKDFKLVEEEGIKLSTAFFDEKEKFYKCNVNYNCRDNNFDNFTIEIIVLLHMNKANFKEKLEFLKGEQIKLRVKEISLDKLIDIDYLSVKEINEVPTDDLKNSVYETLFADFQNLEELKENILSDAELLLLLKDVFLTK